MPRKQVLMGGDPDSLSLLMSFFSNTDKFDVSAVHDGHEALRALGEMKPPSLHCRTPAPDRLGGLSIAGRPMTNRLSLSV